MAALLNRYFIVFGVFTLVLSAYFTARGVSFLIAEEIVTEMPETDTPIDSRLDVAFSPSGVSCENRRNFNRDAKVILKRNLFDSQTGPIDPESRKLASEKIGRVFDKVAVELNRTVVPCEDKNIRVLATVANPNNQDFSFATISKGKESLQCRVGDEIANREVAGITWRYVFLHGKDNDCYLDLFEDKAIPNRRHAKKYGKRLRRRLKRLKRQNKYADRIAFVSKNERVIDKSLVSEVLTNPNNHFEQTRLQPYRNHGEIEGFRIRELSKKGLLYALGTKRNDIIRFVDSTPLDSLDNALAAYESLSSFDDFVVGISRRGRQMDMTYRIR